MVVMNVLFEPRNNPDQIKPFENRIVPIQSIDFAKGVVNSKIYNEPEGRS